MYDTITLTTDARGIATLTLNRPDKHNALSAQMIGDITQAAQALDRDPAVRVVVIAGAGASFCAGGDLAWMRAQIDATPQDRANSARALAAMLAQVNTLSKPVIARIHGNAFGGGIGLACVCDKVFATAEAKFGLTETKLGLIPATIGPYVVARMGGGAARQVFSSSRVFNATTAQALGIVSTLTTPQDLDAEVEAEVQAYLRCAPAAIAQAKAMVLNLGGAPSDAVVEATITALLDRWAHPEAQQGITAFFDKTAPPWA